MHEPVRGGGGHLHIDMSWVEQAPWFSNLGLRWLAWRGCISSFCVKWWPPEICRGSMWFHCIETNTLLKVGIGVGHKWEVLWWGGFPGNLMEATACVVDMSNYLCGNTNSRSTNSYGDKAVDWPFTSHFHTIWWVGESWLLYLKLEGLIMFVRLYFFDDGILLRLPFNW